MSKIDAECAKISVDLSAVNIGSWEDIMKTVVIGEKAEGVTREAVMAVYPRHKVVADKYINKGDVIGLGPFADGGNMGIFKTRTAAEQFAAEDPFKLEGLIKTYAIHDWSDSLLPE